MRLADSTDPDSKADAFVTALFDWLLFYMDLNTTGGDVSSSGGDFDVAHDAAGIYRVSG